MKTSEEILERLNLVSQSLQAAVHVLGPMDSEVMMLAMEQMILIQILEPDGDSGIQEATARTYWEKTEKVLAERVETMSPILAALGAKPPRPYTLPADFREKYGEAWKRAYEKTPSG